MKSTNTIFSPLFRKSLHNFFDAMYNAMYKLIFIKHKAAEHAKRPLYCYIRRLGEKENASDTFGGIFIKTWM